ncbi:hypothetical protein, partial [Rhizobium sp. 1399]|uniref:hypothetical protein n=1 Tax=Rhizobium sp. 1399 TaxID=2817758 RepID=UPI0028646869
MTISTFPPDRNVPLPAVHYEPRFQTEMKSEEFDLTSGLRLLRRRMVMIAALMVVLMAAFIVLIS